MKYHIEIGDLVVWKGGRCTPSSFPPTVDVKTARKFIQDDPSRQWIDFHFYENRTAFISLNESDSLLLVDHARYYLFYNVRKNGFHIMNDPDVEYLLKCSDIYTVY